MSKKSKHSKNLEITFENLGISRMYTIQKRSKAIREYLSANKAKRKSQIKEIEDFIFGRIEENPLQDILDEYNKSMKDLDKKIEHIVKSSKRK
jgi:hypothetical protein